MILGVAYPGFIKPHRYDSAEHDFFFSYDVMLFDGSLGWTHRGL
jgi:hypothetical protein